MNKSPKMNVLYLISFILMFVCVALLMASVVIMVVFDQHISGVLCAVAGVFLCLIAIILAMFSKPKKPKAPKMDNSSKENYIDASGENSAVSEEISTEETEPALS